MQIAFEFPAKTTREPWISPQGSHPGANVWNKIANSFTKSYITS